MNSRFKRRVAFALVVAAFGVSFFGGQSVDAKDPSFNGSYSTNSVTWCRTC